MHYDKLKDFLGNLSQHDLATGAAAVVGIVLLVLIFRTGKSFGKVLLFLIAIGLFAGPYRWRNRK
jgi:hypothetical protein